MMNKTQCVKFNLILAVVLIAGCASTAPQENPLNAVGQGLSTIENAAQSGRQIIDAGTAAATTASTNQIGLVDILMRQLGVSQEQALGGAGAIFQAAQGNMNPQAFATLSQSIPGMNTMLGAAPASPIAGGLSSLMGSGNNTLGNMAGLAASFQQLNLSPDLVGQFIPIITNYVSQTSGQMTANLLQTALTAR